MGCFSGILMNATSQSEATWFSIRHKFALLFFVLQLLALLAVGHVAIATVDELAEDGAQLSMRYAVRRMIRDATLFHVEAQRDIRTALANSVFVEYFSLPETRSAVEKSSWGKISFTKQQLQIKSRVDQWLLALQKWYPLTESCLIDKNGKEHSRATHGVLSTLESYSSDEGENPFFAPSFQMEEGEVYTVHPYFATDSNQWVFAYTSPVVMENGDKPAFLHIEISASHFQDLVKSRKGSYFDRLVNDHGSPEVVGSDRYIIIDENGSLVADSQADMLLAEKADIRLSDVRFSDVLPKSHTLSTDPSFQEIILQMRRGEGGAGKFVRENRLHLISYHPLPFFGWSLAAIRPYDNLLESRWDMGLIKQVLTSAGGAVLLLSALIVWLVVGRMVQPLRALTQAARDVAAGKQDTLFPECSRRDEIGQLAQSLKQMRETILDYHHDLEVKISQRTEKFLGANMKLQETIEELEGTREELVHREKMASLGRLVAGFAHEINTPVGIAIGSLSVVPEGINQLRALINQEEVDGEVLDRLLARVDEAAKLGLANLSRAAEIVSRFKRTSVDQSMEAARLFNVREAVDDVVLSLHSQFRKTRIWIDTDCPPGINVYSQPGALGQVLTNLMMNSLIHGFDQGQQAGTIEIKTNLSDDGSHVIITYSDTGRGMVAEVVKKIFDPFFTTARDKGGSGLGMYICYNIIRTQLKGTIECGSHPGEGSVFVIEFPVGLLNPRQEEEAL